MKPGLIWLELKQAISGIIFNDDGREAVLVHIKILKC
jgi:hypothetical protein